MDDGIDSAELQAELARLKEEHRDLDRAIEALESAPVHDRLQLQRLKKRKLTLRDRIHRIEDDILPDIIA
ncbi:YdcH family protein [Salinarimonas sp. NSM]|uniref:YdcH family protein n=1 Tax=Salinarimonas sp. NSM TaxID=3458003 RepID=UPI00403506E5